MTSSEIDPCTHINADTAITLLTAMKEARDKAATANGVHHRDREPSSVIEPPGGAGTAPAGPLGATARMGSPSASIPESSGRLKSALAGPPSAATDSGVTHSGGCMVVGSWQEGGQVS